MFGVLLSPREAAHCDLVSADIFAAMCVAVKMGCSMVLPTVHSIRSGRKLANVRASVAGSAAVATGLDSVTAAVTWADEFGPLRPQRTICGHRSTSTMTLLESAGQIYCMSCFTALKRLVSDYDSGQIDSRGAAARLRGLGSVREDEVDDFLKQLSESAKPSDLNVARATMRRLSIRRTQPGAAVQHESQPKPTAGGLTVRCKQCNRLLFGDPRAWRRSRFDFNQLGLQLLAGESASRPANRLDLPDTRGELARSAVEVVVEDAGQGRGARLRVYPHRRWHRGGQCHHAPSIGFAELVAACAAAEAAGQDYIRI